MMNTDDMKGFTELERARIMGRMETLSALSCLTRKVVGDSRKKAENQSCGKMTDLVLELTESTIDGILEVVGRKFGVELNRTVEFGVGAVVQVSIDRARVKESFDEIIAMRQER